MICDFVMNRFLVEKPMKPIHPLVKKETAADKSNDQEDESSDQEPLSKKQKGKRGMNKNRPRQPRPNNKTKLCSFIANGEECQRGEKCFFEHSLEEFMKIKQPDIGDKCAVFERFGKCPYGVNCRFGKSHLDDKNNNFVDEELYSKMQHLKTKDTLKKELQIALRKRQYKFPRTAKYLATLSKDYKGFSKNNNESKPVGSVTNEDSITLRPNEKKKVILACTSVILIVILFFH